ncbi:MAG: hypothetical protein Ta2G_05780 [Termitinemataceae bacterium]|nr:MAG: hypothetical protein Ta2G_05780 [Termitinemataceae bacterium]
MKEISFNYKLSRWKIIPFVISVMGIFASLLLRLQSVQTHIINFAGDFMRHHTLIYNKWTQKLSDFAVDGVIIFAVFLCITVLIRITDKQIKEFFSFTISKKDKATIILLFSITSLLCVSNILFNSFKAPTPVTYTIIVILYSLIIDLLILILWVFAVKYSKIGSVYMFFEKLKNNIINNKLHYFVILAASVITEVLFSLIKHTDFISFRLMFFIATYSIIFFIYKYKGKSEKLFFSVSILTGLMLASVLPPSEVSWDEKIHYEWAIEKSFFIQEYPTSADLNFEKINEKIYYDSNERKIKIDEKNAEHKAGFYENVINPNLLLVSHIPAGLFLFVGRSINLPFLWYFILGRMANVLIYSIVVFFALKRLKTGKYILATIALFPTCIFLASNYTYDYWVTSFTMLGVAYFLREIQESDKKIEFKNIIIMLSAFVFGLLPKAVYFPLMALLYFIGKKKFLSVNAYRKYLFAVTIALLFIISSFMLPFILSNGGGQGDLRGGPEVNSTEQTRFILNHPLEYITILLNFLQEYLSLENSKGYITNFAYLGLTPYFMLIFATLIVVVFTDKNKFDVITSEIKIKILIFSASFIAIALVASALYISFTPVHLNTINGCQGRYIIPLVFPCLAVLGSSKIKQELNQDRYSIIIFGILSFVLMGGIWVVVVSNYF